MINLLDNLNKEQIEAVTTTEGYVRVIAGAGSGKTRALTSRYVYLVDEYGISTSNILCVTFTNKAANEMKKRIREMIGDNDTGLVCTFHGFGVQFLREEIYSLNYPHNFFVMDEEDVEAILKKLYQQFNLNTRVYTFSKAKEDISLYKNSNLNYVDDLVNFDTNKLKEKIDNTDDIAEKVLYGYLFEQRKCYGLDYDDLILFTLYILKKFEKIRRKWQEKLMYVMVDEFQDVNLRNNELVEILSCYHKNLFVVGDPDQTIYSWRGARVEIILNFDKVHKDCKTIILNKNYRSTPNILNAANSLISKNENRIKKDLVAIKEENVSVVYNHAKTTKDEALWIVSQIKELKSKEIKLKDIAVLYRTHNLSKALEETFLKKNIKYILYNGIEFYKRKEIKDVLSYMRMIAFSDDLSFLRVVNEPKRNIGETRIKFLNKYAQENNCDLYRALYLNLNNELFKSTEAKEFVDLIEKYKSKYKEMSIADLFHGILNDSGYEEKLRTIGDDERLDNLAELKQSIFEYENSIGEDISLEGYLDRISLFTNLEPKEKEDAIKMMTIHTAKGLEFPYVFICGMNEGILPSKRVQNISELEEERRLAYVAYTRAKNALFLSDAEGVNTDKSFRYPSRFIFNTDKCYLNYIVELDENLITEANHKIEMSEKSMIKFSDYKYKIGQVVEHRGFGKGVIKDIDYNMGCYIIKFDQFDTFRSINVRMPLQLVEEHEPVQSNLYMDMIDDNDEKVKHDIAEPEEKCINSNSLKVNIKSIDKVDDTSCLKSKKSFEKKKEMKYGFLEKLKGMLKFKK